MTTGGRVSKLSISNNIASRIAAARAGAGLTLREAATQLGFDSYQTLSKIEKGKRQARALDLVKLAALYGRNVTYFLSADAPVERPAVLWRGRVDSPTRAKVEQRFLQYCEDYARLEQLAGRAAPKFPLKCGGAVSSFDEAYELGESLASRMELGSRPANGIWAVVEERLGVKVFVTDTAGAGSAASVTDSFGSGILLSHREPPWRVNFSLAHELFHLVTWGMYDTDKIHPKGSAKSLPEKFADAFASALLLPETSIGKAFRARVSKDRILTYVECITLAREFGVSTQALLYRLIGLGLVRRKDAETAMKSDDFVTLNKEQRKNDWGGCAVRRFSERFIGLAYECLLDGKLSRARFAEMLGIQRDEIDTVLFAHGYDTSGDYSGAIGAS